MARETDLIYKFASDPGIGDDADDGYQLGDDWLNTSTGDVFTCRDITVGAAVWKERLFDPLAASNLPEGIQGFFLEAKGNFGTGAGWADSGFITLFPVLLFNSNATERSIHMFFSLLRVKLDAVDPQIGFVIYSTGAPSAAEAIRWRLTCRYKADGDALGGAADEVLLQTQVLTTLVADSRQTTLFFTLDRTKISNEDVMHFNLERLGGDGADTYGDDIGVGQSGALIEVQLLNP